jgi:Zn-dependent protease with chaperone function
MRKIVGTVAVAVVLTVGSQSVEAGPPRRPKDPAARALAFFNGSEADGGQALIGRLRPSALSPALRVAVVAALPREGELEPTAAERAKIAALDPIFAVHERQGLVVVKVIEVGHAFVGLHARSVLLLSRDALSLLDAEELQALAAHELGHELFWDEYQEARARGAHDITRELELRCDGVAVATLHRLGRGPESLVDAVVKMTRYNEAIGATASGANYVSLERRRQFIREVAELFGVTADAAVSRSIP